MNLLIGCPIYKRAWIVDRWYKHAVAAARKAQVKPSFVLVGDPISDAPTFNALDQVNNHSVTVLPEYEGHSGLRDWNPKRYQRMVYLRNRLLGVVRSEGPDYFLSLDSDILLHPDAITALLAATDRFDAVGGKCYMTSTGVHCPSYAKLPRNGGFHRTESEGTFAVDVIMAIKLMSPKAYNVDYQTDHHGEDTGWSKAARLAGVKLGWAGSVVSKHVMAPESLDKVDKRVGF